MKKYVEKIDRWKTAKVLEFLGNFLKNHSGSVQVNYFEHDAAKALEYLHNLHEQFKNDFRRFSAVE